MDHAQLRKELIDTARGMNSLGINQGTSGNVSARSGNEILITPTSIAYEALEPAHLAIAGLTATPQWRGPLPPSSEWRLHHAIFQNFPQANAIIHTHASFATTLSMARREIPACHYMIGIFGGAPIRCALYATFGTQQFADLAVTALAGRNACLLANHGMVVWGASLAQALWRAVELETLAKQYYHSLLLGGPVLLSDAELAETTERLHGYGVQPRP